MIWLAPGAFVGLLAVAAPMLVHWLARQQAERVRFPTLQFLVRTPPVSVRRHRLRDLLLLVIRAALIVAAVAALAQPVWVRPAARAARPARAIVVDTSASLARTLGDGRVGREVAREAAEAFGAGAGTSAPPARVIPAERLATGVAQAAVWLEGQDAPRELIVVSDFQVGALVLSDIQAVPADAGVRLVPVSVSGPVPAAPAPARGRLRVYAGAPGSEGARRAAAAETAARATMTSEVVSGEPAGNDLRGRLEISLIFASAPDYAALRTAARPIDTPELFGWATDIRQELRRLGAGHELVADCRAIRYELMAGLAVFTDADPGSIEAATLMAAILRASAPPALTPAEREPDTLAPATLQAWQREPAGGAAPRGPSGRSDGRWGWALVLALLAVETWIRRSLAPLPTQGVHADAA